MTAQPHLADRPLVCSPLNSTGHVDRMARWKVHDNPRRERVAIFGCGLGRERAPLDDPTWAVWTCNLVAPYDAQGRLRCDRWFDLHQRHAQSADDLRWIARCPVPIYLPPDLVAASERGALFPLEAIERRWRGYWACTFAYQVALALWEGYREVGLYGVELGYGTRRERTVEWACLSWWCGLAEGLGCRVTTAGAVLLDGHDGRDTFRPSLLGRHPHRYGLEYDAEKAWVDRYVGDARPPLEVPA